MAAIHVTRVPARVFVNPAVVATTAALAGVLATAAGGGLGIRYLQKAGLSLASVVGMVFLVVGVALLVGAATISWRALHRWWRLVLLPAGLICLVLIACIGQAVMYTNVPRTKVGSATPAARGLAYSDVTFPAGDGVRLSAWLVPSHNKAMVILLHGAGENRTATLPQAVVLARHGYGALLVDARGQGHSAGKGMELGWWGDRDVAGAVSFLRQRPDVDPARIAVLGLSMGGEEAIGAAGSNLGIRAVIAEGATQRTAADKDGWLPGGVSGALQRGLDWLTFGVTGVLTPAPEPRPLYESVARASTTPFLLIAAGTKPDETRSANHLRDAAPNRVQVWTAPGAAHTHALAAHPAEWEARVTAFLAAALRAS